MRYVGPSRWQAQANLTGNKRSRMAGLRSGEIADRNIRVILEAIRRHGPLTRLELGQHCGLSGPGITNIVRRLAAEGLIGSSRRTGGASGLSSTEFALRPEGAFSIGVRLRSSRGEIALVDLGGHVHERKTFAVTGTPIGIVENEVHKLIESRPASLPIVGLGIAANDWTDRQRDDLASVMSLPRTVLATECVALMLAERTLRDAVPLDGLAMIIIDDDIQAGFLIRGLPFAGVRGKAGNIGDMQTGADNVTLNDAVGFSSLMAVLGKGDFDRLLDGHELQTPAALDTWVRRAAGHLLDPILAIAGFVAPTTIMIGGDLPRSLIEGLIVQLSIERRNTAVRPYLTPWMSPIKPSSFGSGGIALGAALLPFLDTLLPPPLAG